ncbi:MFS transporter [Frankia sp. AiPs1]|uniref:MFS transporter n=1 Tax=Frankia sp. AiPs1 TaxID=573493 RepID=UPI002043B1BC|nr:MFS transporter [Frankia sp. AiPs1]MCM3920537.1 MFS transporter [Frankia sp. AiPs1]
MSTVDLPSAPEITEVGPARLAVGPLAVLSLGYFLVMLDVTVVTVAVPAFQTSLHAGATSLQWVVDGYSTTFAALLLLGGGLGERLGHRRVFMVGLALFGLASVLCALAVDTGVLVAGRMCQGAGAALLVPTSLALLAGAYPQREIRARALGFWASIAGVAFAAGPLVGGLLLAGLSWRAVFWLNVPVVAVAMVLTTRMVPRPAVARNHRRMDPAGQAAAAVGLTGLAGALNEAASGSWTSPLVLGGFAVAVVALAGFIANEHRLDRRLSGTGFGRPPMLPLSLFRSFGFAATALIGVLLNLGYYGILYLSTLYFQQQRHYDALTTGLLLLPSVCMALIAAPLSGRLTARFGPYRPMGAALLLGSLGFLGWLPAGAHSPYAILLFALIATGLATPMTVPAATAAIIDSAPPDRSAAASAVFNVARQIGNAVGVALFGTLAATSSSLVAGLHISAIIAFAVFLLGSLLAFSAGRRQATQQ